MLESAVPAAPDESGRLRRTEVLGWFRAGLVAFLRTVDASIRCPLTRPGVSAPRGAALHPRARSGAPQAGAGPPRPATAPSHVDPRDCSAGLLPGPSEDGPGCMVGRAVIDAGLVRPPERAFAASRRIVGRASAFAVRSRRPRHRSAVSRSSVRFVRSRWTPSSKSSLPKFVWGVCADQSPGPGRRSTPDLEHGVATLAHRDAQVLPRLRVSTSNLAVFDGLECCAGGPVLARGVNHVPLPNPAVERRTSFGRKEQVACLACRGFGAVAGLDEPVITSRQASRTTGL